MPQRKESEARVGEVALDQLAIARRRAALPETLPRAEAGNYLCHFCGRRFKHEVVFMRHHCEQKRKQQELQSPTGQAALSYYRAWLRHRGFREQGVAAFLESKSYRAFIKFAQFVHATNLPAPERYVQLMVENTIQPPLWCSSAAYSLYLRWLDTKQNPLVQVADSVEVIMALAEKENVKPKKLLQHVGPQRVLELIIKRQLSPWFLFHSTSFSKLFSSLPVEEQRAFSKALNANLWAERLRENEALREDIKAALRELEL